jgi:hypothetical protein
MTIGLAISFPKSEEWTIETKFRSLRHSVELCSTIRRLASPLAGRMGQTPTLLLGDAGQSRFQEAFPGTMAQQKTGANSKCRR